MSEMPMCVCADFYDGHHNECPVRREIERLQARNEVLEKVLDASNQTVEECAEMDYDHSCCCYNWTMLENSQHQCGLCELREAIAATQEVKE